MVVCSTTTARTGSFKVRHQLTLGRRPAADGQARSDRSTGTHDGTCTETESLLTADAAHALIVCQIRPLNASMLGDYTDH